MNKIDVENLVDANMSGKKIGFQITVKEHDYNFCNYHATLIIRLSRTHIHHKQNPVWKSQLNTSCVKSSNCDK